MAIPTFVAAGTKGEGTAGVTPGMPTGATTGDLLLLHIEGEGEDANADGAPTGGAWTLIGSVASNTNGQADRTRHTVYWAWYDAAINLSVPDAGNHTLAVITAWRGVHATAPIHGSQSSSSATNNTGVSATGFNTTVNDCLIVVSSAAGDDITFSGWANASLSSVTERADVNTTAGTDGSIGVASGGLATAGATGTTTATVSATEEEANWVIALQPAGATAYDETGRSVVITSTVTATDVWAPAPGSITLIQTATDDNGGVDTTSVTITFGTTPVQGNLMVAVLTTSAARTFTLPTGWNLAINSDDRCQLFYRVAGAAEPTGHTFTFAAGTAVRTNGHLHEWAGLHDVQGEVLDKTGSFLNEVAGTHIETGDTPTTAYADALAIGALSPNGNRTFSGITDSFTLQTTLPRSITTSRILTATGIYGHDAVLATDANIKVGVIAVFRKGVTGPTYDETGKAISVTSTIGHVNTLNAIDVKAITVTSTVSKTDTANMADLARAVSIISTLIANDTLTFNDLLNAISIASTLNASDLLTMSELARSTNITSTVSTTSTADFADLLKAVSIVSTVSASDALTFNELLLATTIASTVNKTDEASFTNTSLPVTLTSVINLSDLFAGTNALAVSIASTITSVDTYTPVGGVNYNETGRAFTITSTITLADATNVTEAATVTVTSTLSMADVLAAIDALSVTLLSTVNLTNVQAMVQAALATSITSTVTSVDDYAMTELLAMVGAVTLDSFDTATLTDALSFIITSFINSSDVLDDGAPRVFYERDLYRSGRDRYSRFKE